MISYCVKKRVLHCCFSLSRCFIILCVTYIVINFLSRSSLIFNIWLYLNTVVPNKNGQEQPRGLRRQYCEENADCENFYSNPSNMMEVSPGYKEEKEDGTTD